MNRLTKALFLLCFPICTSPLMGANYAVVANAGDGTISVINPNTNTPYKTIRVDEAPHAVAISSNGAYIYTANAASNTVSIYDVAAGRMINTLAVGLRPSAIALKPGDDSTVYVLNYDDNTVSVINTSTFRVTATISLLGGMGNSQGFNFAPPTYRYAYIPNYFNGTIQSNISILDTQTSSVTTVTAGVGPKGLAFLGNAGTAAAVVNEGGAELGTITVLNLSNFPPKSVTSVTAGADAAAIIANPKVVYVANRGGTSVSIFAPTALFGSNPQAGATTLTVGSQPLAFGWRGGNNDPLIVANSGSNDFSVINPANAFSANPAAGMVTGAAGTNPIAVAVSNDGLKGFIANHGSNNVTTIDLSLWGTSFFANGVTTAAAGSSPTAITYGNLTGSNPLAKLQAVETQYVYVTNTGSDGVSVINTATNLEKILAGGATAISVDDAPQQMVANSDGSLLYVANSGFGTISVIDTSLNRVVETLLVGGNPSSMAISPSGTHLLVRNAATSAVSINTATNRIENVYSTPAGLGNEQPVFAPNTNIGYIPIYANPGSVFIMDLNNFGSTGSTSVTALSNPQAVSFGPTTAYIVNSGSNNLTPIPITTHFPVKAGTSISGAGPLNQPIDMVTTSLGYGYVANAGVNYVTLIDLTNPKGSGATILGPVSTSGGALILTPNQKNVYVLGNGVTDSDVWVIDTGRPFSPGGATSITGFGSGAQWGAFTPNADSLYVAHSNSSILTDIPVGFNSSVPTATILIGTVGGVTTATAGTNPFWPVVVSNPKAPTVARSGGVEYAYIADGGANQVSVINTANQMKIKDILVDFLPNALAASPDGSAVYVANWTSQSVSVISTSTNRVIATVGAGELGSVDLQFISVTPDSSRVLVGASDGTIYAISTSNYTVLDQVTLAGAPGEIYFNPSTGDAYVPVASANKLYLIDSSDLARNVSVPTVGTKPVAVAFNADATRAYVVNETSKSVTELNIEGASPSVAPSFVTMLATNDFPFNMAVASNNYGFVGGSAGNVGVLDCGVSPMKFVRNVQLDSSGYFSTIQLAPNDLGYAYITDTTQSKVYVVDTGRPYSVGGATSGTVGSKPNAIAFTLDGSQAYVTNNGSNNASVISTQYFSYPLGFETPNSVTSAIAAAGPTALVIVPNIQLSAPTPTGAAVGGKLYIANTGETTVSVIDMATNTTTQTFDVGGVPYAIAIEPNGRYGYVSTSSNKVVQFRTSDNQIVNPGIAVGNTPRFLTISPDGKSLFVSNTDDNTISELSMLSNQVLRTFSSKGNGPVFSLVSEDNSHLYVANTYSQIGSNIALVDLSNPAGATTVTAGTAAGSFAISSDQRYLYIPNADDHTTQVKIIDTLSPTGATGVTTATAGLCPNGFVVGPNRFGFVTNRLDPTINIFDLSVYPPRSITSVTAGVGDLSSVYSVLSPDGNYVYVNTNNGRVFVIDTGRPYSAGGVTSATTMVNPNGGNIVFAPNSSDAYVASPVNNTVYAIETANFNDPIGFATAGSVTPIEVGEGPIGGVVAGSPATGDPLQAPAGWFGAGRQGRN